MLRLLVVSNAYPSDEKPYAGVFVRNQVAGLSNLGVDAHVFAMRRTFTGRVGSVLKYLSAFARFMPQLLRSYDVVHVHFLSPLLFPAWLYALVHPRSKLVLTVHGSGVRRLEHRRVARTLYAALLRRVDTLHAVGRTLAEDATRLLRRPVDLVLPAGVDRRIFRPMPDEDDVYDFIFVGSLTRTKGFDLLIEAYRNLAGRPTLCVVGSGEFADQLGGLEGVVYRESLPPEEVAREMNRARFLVLPTRMDAFGLVVAEAMSCGVPVLATAVDGMLEQITENANGLFVRPSTAEALAKVMEVALNLDFEDYQELSEGALRVNPEYALDAVCARLVDVYEAGR